MQSANLTHGQASSSNSTPTASIAPTANALVLVAVANKVGSGIANVPTISGGGLTWADITSEYAANSDQTMVVTVFRGTSATPGSGAITIDFSGQTQSSILWSVDQFLGTKTTGTNGSGAIVQNAVNNIYNTPALTVALSAFASQQNATYGWCAAHNSTGTVSGGSFTQLSQPTQGGDIANAQWSQTPQTSVNWTLSGTSGGAANMMAIALEIAAVPAGGAAGVATM